MEKIAVFDLDGTLYKENSHIEILSEFYKTNIYKSLILKIFYKIFPKYTLKILKKQYDLIPNNFKRSFILPFRESALRLLEKKRREGYKIIIISNAPFRLVENAAKKLNVTFEIANIGEKDKVLKKYFYKKLMVCSDNTTDINILKLANEKYIYIKDKKIKRKFKNVKEAFFLEE